MSHSLLKATKLHVAVKQCNIFSKPITQIHKRNIQSVNFAKYVGRSKSSFFLSLFHYFYVTLLIISFYCFYWVKYSHNFFLVCLLQFTGIFALKGDLDILFDKTLRNLLSILKQVSTFGGL